MQTRRRLKFWFVLLAVSCATTLRAEETTQGKGSLLFAGGALRFNNDAVWGEFVRLAGGKGAPVVVIPAAAGRPITSGQLVVDHLKRLGLQADLLLIAPRFTEVDVKKAARDPANLAKLRKARGIWFLGGEQRRITQALLNEDGSQTPALKAIWDSYRRGAVLGGTSAGTAIMSQFMFADAMNSIDTLKHGITKGTHVDAGLGFVGSDWFVDQHFLVRGRFARTLVAMQKFGYKYAIGVDEDTAVVMTAGRFKVVGYSGALILDTSTAQSDANVSAFNIKKARLTYLDTGDSIDLKTRKVVVSKAKADDGPLNFRAKDFVPGYTLPEYFYFPDILSSGAIYQAMRNSVDSKTGIVRGLAFAQPEGGKFNDIGFEFRIYRGADTKGWYTSRGGQEAYTIAHSYVDITPVKLARPLYTPLAP